MTLIIDPPSVFASIEEWTAFRLEMERLTVAEPDNLAAREALATARDEEARRS